MVIMITRARVFGRKDDVVLAAVIFLVAGLIVATISGAILGGLGQFVGSSSRTFAAGAALVAITVLAAAGRRPWQLDRETSLGWLRLANWRTAAYNGASLGAGLATRVGFWVFYLVPIGAFFAGEVNTGIAVYATYSLTRTGLSLIIALISFRSEAFVATVLRLQKPLHVPANLFLYAAAGCMLGAMWPA